MPIAAPLLMFAAGSGAAAAIGSALATTLVGATVSTLAATAIGTGVIAGTITAAQGGKVSDVLKSAVVGGVASFVGGYVGTTVGASVAGATGSSLAGNLAGNVASGLAQGVIRGQDLRTSLLGGLAGSVGSVLGDIPGFSELPNSVQSAVTATARAAITGQDIPTALIGSLTTSTGILSSAIQSIPGAESIFNNPENKDVVQLVTGTLSGALTAAVRGTNLSDAVRQALINTSANMLQQQFVGGFANEKLNKNLAAAQAAYETAENTFADISQNENLQRHHVDRINEIAGPLQDMETEFNRLVADYETKKQAYDQAYNTYLNAPPYSREIEDAHRQVRALLPTVNQAADTANNYAKEYEQYWNANKLVVEESKTALASLKDEHSTLTTAYTNAVETLQTSSSNLGAALGELTDNSNKSFVTALDPNFNADQYRSINNLPAETDVYEHYLSTGMTAGLPTNTKSAEAQIASQQTRLVDEVLAASGVTSATADPAQISKIISNIRTAYGNDVTALRNATAQDVIQSNRETLGALVSEQRDGVLRIDVGGVADYGEWNPPAEQYSPPPGTRLATKDEFNDGTAQKVYMPDGNVVWVSVDNSVTSFDTTTGQLTAPDFGSAPTDVDKLIAYGANPDAWKGTVSQYVLDAAKTTLEWAQSTKNSTIINTAANVIKAGGGFLESINGISVLAGYAPKNTALGKFADALQQIGKAGNTAEYQAAIKNMQTMIGDAKGVGGTLKAIYGAFKSAPMEFLAEYVGVEGIQEVAPLLIGGAAATGAKGAALALRYGEAVAGRIATGAGLTAAMTTDIIESAGGSAKKAYDEAYRSAIKAGKSEADADKIALDIAQRSALVAAGTTAVSMGLGGAAVERVLLGRSGTGLGDALQSLGDFAKTGTKIAIREGVAEGGEEGVIQAYLEGQLYKLDPTRDVAGNITAAAAFGAIAGGPIAGSAYGASRTGDVISNALLANPTVANTINNAPDAASAAQELSKLGISGNVTQANLLNTKFDSAYTSSYEAQTALNSRTDFTATDADIDALTGATPNADLANVVERYVEANVVDENEVKAAYEALGLEKPTQDDIKKLMGQYAETELASKAEANLPAARYNSVMEQLDGMRAGASQEVLDAIDTVKRDFNAQLADVGVDISKVSSEIGATKDELTAAINDAQKGDAARFGAIDKAIADLRAAGLTEAQVQKIVNDSSAGVSKDFKDALDAAVKGNNEALTKIQTDLTTKIGDVQAALETKLGDQKTAFDAKVKELMDQGKTYQEATETALEDVGIKISDLGTDFAIKLKDTSDTLSEQIGSLSTRLSDVEKSLLDNIAANEKAGLSRDEATQKAVTDLAAELGTTKENVLKQIGATEATLNTRVDTLQQTFAQQLSDVEKSLLDNIAANEKAGLSRDEATQKAVDDLAAELGTTKDDVLKQLGATEATLNTRVDTLQQTFAQQLSDVEKSLLDNIAANEKAGLSRDEATQKAVTDLAAELGTTKENVLKQIGATEATLNTRVDTLQRTFTERIETSEVNILTKMAEYEKAGIGRDEALSKAVADVATQLGTTKEDLLKQIGTTEANLKTQVNNVEASLGTKITESQEAILKELGLAKTGLSEEIAGVKESLTTRIGDVQANILNRMADYEKAGISRDEALGRAVDDVAAQLGTTRDDVLTRIGETEAALKGDISTAKQEVLARAAEYEKAGIARDEALSRAVADTEQRLGTKIGYLQTTVGQKATPATQQDLDAVINLLQQQGAYDPQYDYNGDRVIDQKDKIAIETVLRSQQPDYQPDPNQPFRFAPATGTKWASTGIFGEIDASRLAAENAIANEAARTRAAQEQAALKTQRLGNLNTMMQMLGQAGDIGGQQVTVKAADPAKIGYIYDWSSIFANPSQEKLFASPYAQGGAVRSEIDDVNEELLKILRG